MGELKKEGDKLFISKEYAKAIEAYERALKALPTGAVEAADLYSNKAACFYQLKK